MGRGALSPHDRFHVRWVDQDELADLACSSRIGRWSCTRYRGRNLIDEYRLILPPLFLGTGNRFFADELRYDAREES
jgi:hypothetical protein